MLSDEGIMIGDDGWIIGEEGDPCCCGEGENPDLCTETCETVKFQFQVAGNVLIDEDGGYFDAGGNSFTSFSVDCADITEAGGYWYADVFGDGSLVLKTLSNTLPEPPGDPAAWEIETNTSGLDPIELADIACCSASDCDEVPATISLAGLLETIQTDQPDDAMLDIWDGTLEQTTGCNYQSPGGASTMVRIKQADGSYFAGYVTLNTSEIVVAFRDLGAVAHYVSVCQNNIFDATKLNSISNTTDPAYRFPPTLQAE